MSSNKSIDTVNEACCYEARLDVLKDLADYAEKKNDEFTKLAKSAAESMNKEDDDKEFLLKSRQAILLSHAALFYSEYAKKLQKELIVTYKNFERFNKQRVKSMTMRLDSLKVKTAKLQAEVDDAEK